MIAHLFYPSQNRSQTRTVI